MLGVWRARDYDMTVSNALLRSTATAATVSRLSRLAHQSSVISIVLCSRNGLLDSRKDSVTTFHEILYRFGQI